MFFTCHITFGQLSNFVGPSLEVTRTIRNNKLHFTWGCFNLLYKKKEKGPETDFLFLKMIPTFFKSILTSLAIRYSQNVFRGFSILMCIGVQVFFWWLFFSIFTPSLACDSLSRSPPFDRKTVKNCACSSDPGLLNETKGSWFPLSCLSS